MSKLKKLRWGIVGCGQIARLFAEDLKLVPNAELVAVASKSSSRANKFAQEFNSVKAYSSYHQLFEDPNVDVVYIATLHHTHAMLSIEAMSFGNHVLCEKPLAINKDQACQMARASSDNNVFFMEAFWSRFNPSIIKINELIKQGSIGKIRYINAEFTFFKLDDDPSSRLLNVNLAGGSLLDMGVYPIFLSYLLLGIPKEILSRSQFFKTGAEIQTSMIFQYDNAQAILYSGFANNTDMKAKICGEDGEIFINPLWFETQEFQLVRGGKHQSFNLPKIGKGFAHEILEVHECINNNKTESSKWSHQNSIDLISIVDEVRSISGIRFPFED